jgi:hypothetical protein
MVIETIRDTVIIILGILYIIITIGLLVGLFIAYLKIRKGVRNVNEFILKVRKVIAYVKGAAMGFNESMKFFKRGG